MAAVAALLAPRLLGMPAVHGGGRAPAWALLIMFGVVEVCVLHLQVRREAQTVSLHEIPLLIGLFLAAPRAVLLARLLGPVPVLLLVRKQPPVKVLFNTVLFVADAAVSLTVFRLFPVSPDAGPVLVWVPALAAVGAASLFASTATTLVIAATEDRLSLADLWRVPAQDGPRTLAVSVLGLIAVYALEDDVAAGLPLIAAAGVVLVAYRAYAGLSERHLSLERLYQFSQVVSSSPEVDEVLRSVLTQAKEMLRAGSAEITFVSTLERSAVRVVLPPAGRLQRHELEASATSGPVWEQVVADGNPVLLARGSRAPGVQAFLDAVGYRDAGLAPLRGEAGVIGTLLVGDRLGDVRTFDVGDVRLLETVANHAGVAVQHGRLIDQLRHDALHDALTGLPNRVFLQKEIRDALDALERGDVAAVAVGLMDLDGFKEINDTLGHQHGDALLQEVAQRLTTASGDAVVARLGGDEFAFVLTRGAEDVDGVVRSVRLMLHALEQPVDLGGVDVQVGASLGLAFAPEHAPDVSGLLKRADLAMYDAKTAGAGVRVYEPSMDTTDPQRLALVGELRSAIEREELQVHVQPKARLADGLVTGVEALVRWTHPVIGNVPPDQFVPVAERSGLIRPLTMLVLKRTLEAAAAWQEAGSPITVAVNLSARSLVDMDLVEDVGRLLRRYGVAPELLTLEITESSVMTDPGRAMGLLTALQGMGVRLSVDDFGTGYSSLSYLKRLPVHEVKIDRSFVTNMVTDADDRTIVRSIIDLAANLSLDVVAEGVEDLEAWAALRELGATYVQGYVLGRPMPIGELLPWLRTRTPLAGTSPTVVPLRALS
jgi:diguanylate cyclase (GGDEF)-like protein